MKALIRFLLPLLILHTGSVTAADNMAGNMAGMEHDNHLAMTLADNLAMADREIVVDFELVGAGGKTVKDEDFRGRYLLLTFGFTHCEHICPLMAATMGRVLESTGLPAAGLFISVDPERDSPEITHAYAQVFSAKFTGASGRYDAINRAAENFLISYVVTKTQQSYTVSHTASIFLIGPDGTLMETFPLNATPDEITETLKDHADRNGGN